MTTKRYAFALRVASEETLRLRFDLGALASRMTTLSRRGGVGVPAFDQCWPELLRYRSTPTSRRYQPDETPSSARIRSTGISIPAYAEVDTTIHTDAVSFAFER